MLRFAVAVAWACLLTASFAIGSPNAAAQVGQPGEEKNGKIRQYYGVGACTNCHVKGFAKPEENICRGTEIPHWETKDKHKLAYEALQGDRAKKMGILLGGWDVSNRKECKSCHSAWVEDSPAVKFAKTFQIGEGVSCVACHGPELFSAEKKGKFEVGWTIFHGDPNNQEEWRGLDRDQKQTVYGMTDLWDAATRTRVCATCHIGNVELGRIVTHEMYAAGHPPLPPFEVITFTNQMPRHWQYLGEKDEKTRKLVKKFLPTEVELEETHSLAVGGLVALEESLRVLAATKDWPELAYYDCYACHHELTSKSWRQGRNAASKPGRPRLREWPTALVDVGLAHAGAAPGDYQKLLKDLQMAFDAQPFGKADEVKARAKDLADWIGKQVKLLQTQIRKADAFDNKASVKLLAVLEELQQRSHPRSKKDAASKLPPPDFDSARQLAWAWQVLYLETASGHKPEMRRLLAWAMRCTKEWSDLTGYLGLTLPPGQTFLEPSLPEALRRIGQYDPDEFFARLVAVQKRFPRSGG
jgi:hypothetical protein